MGGHLWYFLLLSSPPISSSLLLSSSLPLLPSSLPFLPPHQLTSSDRDKPPYDERTYQFADNSTNTDLFEVEAYTGEVRVSNGSVLDFDGEDNSFTLTVEVTDGVQ